MEDEAERVIVRVRRMRLRVWRVIARVRVSRVSRVR